MRIRKLLVGVVLLILFVAFGAARTLLVRRAEAQAKQATMAPRFEVDPMWPKPLPQPLAARLDDRRVGRLRRITSGSSTAAA